MKKISKWFGLFLIISVASLTQEISVSGIHYPNTPINLSADNEGVWKIESKPTYSNAELVQSGNSAVFTADTVGEFEISFLPELGADAEKTVKRIKIQKFNQFGEEFDEKQIYDIIVESFASKNYTLIKYGIKSFEVSYPTSDYLHKAYIKALELCMDQLYYEDGKKYLEILLYEYKYTKEEKIKYLKLAYEFFEYFDKDEEKLDYLVQLAKYDDFYREKLGKIYITRKASEQTGLSILEKLYKKTYSKQLAAFLGDYYLSKGNEGKAIEYYGNSDRVMQAKLLLKIVDEDEFKELTKDFNEDELEQLKAYQTEKSDLQKMQNYYRYAQNNINKDRLELAEIYLNRIVSQKINNQMKKDAAEQLIELYVIQSRYSQALEIYKTYLDANMTLKDVENLYIKGTIYEKLNDTAKSLEIYDEISEKYPNTIWSTKAQIAKFKINKKNNL